ncbi:MAG: hypothetical protein C0404_02270 [Verrucomicrobia bacterium]|nr:hypothetical protein [Verrucomicrobiota bacterium]
MITAVIFDLDGLLSDTEKLHRRAYREVLWEIGAELSDETYAEHWIRLGKGIGDFIAERKLAVSPDLIRARKSEKYNELVAKYAEPMPGAVELLKLLHGRKTIALASSSYRDSVEAVLGALGIAHFFQATVSGSEVELKKPHPDIFLLAARMINTSPANCVVLEDAEKGVIAAVAAGMKCIAVPNEHTRPHDFSKATRVAGSLREVSLEMIDSL